VQIRAVAEKKYPDIAPLRSVFGVGPVTALTFVLTLADPQRFAKSRDVGCYLGLRRERSQTSEFGSQAPGDDLSHRYVSGFHISCTSSFGKPDTQR
jgi:transposase